MTAVNFKEYITKHKVEIPEIQRDYVQGRGNTEKEKDKRDKFVTFLIDVLEGKKQKAHLQFIYGSSATSRFVPLDGQQRLTTLFLLHWFLWNYSDISDISDISENIEYLKNFRYKTRISSTSFCQRLVASRIKTINNESLSKTLKNQSWFSEDWVLDPTVDAMLQMLDAFQEKLNGKSQKEFSDLYSRLIEKDVITFDTLDMEKFALTDALYIKMNARGKHLTDFENWKSAFIGFLEQKNDSKEFDPTGSRKGMKTYKDYFSYSIEHEWTELFWKYACIEYQSKSEEERNLFYPTIDKSFENYLYFLQSYFHYIDGNKHDSADFGKLSLEEKENLLRSNIDFIFQSLDALCLIGDHKEFFDALFYMTDNIIPDVSFLSTNKVRLFDSNRVNLFESVCKGEASVKEQILFLGLLKFFIKNKTKEVDDKLMVYARCIRNLLEIQTQATNKITTCAPDLRMNQFAKYDDAFNEVLNEVLNISITTPYFFPSTLGLSHTAIECGKSAFIKDTDNIEDYHLLDDCKIWYSNLDVFKNAILKYGLDNVTKAMKAFSEAEEIVKQRILIACGYKGTYLCDYIGGKRYFFGKEGRWDVIFINDKDNSSMAIEEYVNRYMSNPDLQDIICTELKSRTSFDFCYYALKYDEYIKANQSAHFCIYGDHNNMDAIALKSYSNNPATAYHTDPMSCTLLSELKNNDIDVKARYYKQWSGKSPLTLLRTDDKEYFEMISRKDGWIINPDYVSNVPSEAREKYSMILQSDGSLLLKETASKDRIQIAVSFIGDYNATLYK